MMRKIKHRCEAALVIALFACLRALPLDTASAAGERLGVLLGACLKRQSQVARRNLALAFPEKTEAERETILRGMWKHLGRMLGELPHFPGNTLFSRVTCTGTERLPPRGKPVIFASGHVGHWELTYPIAYEYGLPITLIYRHLNNPYLDRYLAGLRASHASAMFPKGVKGAAKLAGALKRGESLALLFDQKMNEGMAVPLFGKDAMTATAVAQFSLRFNLPIIPARVVRTHGCHFTGTVYSPLTIAPTGDTQADTRAILLKLHEILEGWIREHPEQWMWIHRRWDKAMYKEEL